MKYSLSTLLVAICMISLGQNMSVKTNTIHLDLSKGLETASLPEIQWEHPFMEHTNSKENKVTLTASVASATELQSVILHIGNEKTGKKLTSKKLEVIPGAKSFTLDQSLWLPEGPAYVELETTNVNGATVSSIRKITIGEDVLDNLLSIERKDYALLFATDRYDYWDDLVNPIDDAYAIGKTLEDKYGFQVEIVENASLEEVWEKLREYNERKFGPQDQLMLFFAGHGHYDESFGEGYVVASNSLNNDKARTSYISHNRLRGVVDNIPCEHILLTMDVCFGGTLDPRIARNRALKNYEVSVSDMLIRKFQKKTRKYLTSGGKEYVSDGIPGKHSPFANKMLQALKSEGGDDKVLTMSEIQALMENLAQVPRFGAFGADEALSDFVFIAR